MRMRRSRGDVGARKAVSLTLCPATATIFELSVLVPASLSLTSSPNDMVQ
jgi:hypothetical protein